MCPNEHQVNEYDYYKSLYGDLYDEQLYIESRFKQAAQDHLQMVIEKTKQTSGASETKVGRDLTTYKFTELAEEFKAFIEKTLRPKAGAKGAWVNCLKQIDASIEDRDALANLFAFATSSAEGLLSPSVSVIKLLNSFNTLSVCSCELTFMLDIFFLSI
mgnify:CR=1 FL=1